jgi:hypothetical protein
MNTVDPDLKFWLESVERDMLPKMASSAMSIAIFSGSIDAKICLEIGAAVLMDKPIILLALNDTKIPDTLQRAAHTIVRGDPYAEDTQQKLQNALSGILQGGQRER